MPAAAIKRIEITPPTGLGEPDTSMWAAALADLTCPPPGSGPLAENIGVLRSYILAEMIRQKWSSQIKITGPRDVKRWAKTNGEVLHMLLNLISETRLIDSSLPHPITLFHGVLLEFEAEPAFVDTYSAAPQSKREALARCQAQNRALKGLENPFSGAYTKLLFERAIQLAAHFDQFRIDSYTPFRKAREKATSELYGATSQMATIGKSGEIAGVTRQRRKKGNLKPLQGGSFKNLSRAGPGKR